MFVMETYLFTYTIAHKVLVVFNNWSVCTPHFWTVYTC